MSVARLTISYSFSSAIYIEFITTIERVFYFNITETNTRTLSYYQFGIVDISFTSTVDNITIRGSCTHWDGTYFIRFILTRVIGIRLYFFSTLSYSNVVSKTLVATSALVARSRVAVTVPTSI